MPPSEDRMHPPPSQRYFGFVLWSILMVVAGTVLSYAVDTIVSHSGVAGGEFRSGMHGFTNPLLECDVGSDSISSRKEDFTPELEGFIALLEREKAVSRIAVYYRDLNNGPIVSVHSSDPFAPASLLKVPIMMAYLARGESDPAALQQQIFADPAVLPQVEQLVPAEQHINPGGTYSVRELISYMIKYSDNGAMGLLFKRLPVSEQVSLYSLLGVDPTVISDDSATLSVKQYSVFFRVLFNASYLSRTDSEWALKLLSESTFTDGLRKGVPANVPVAHKFGERKFDDGLQQLHDCGIVYYPGHPYLLCVMTRGTDLADLKDALAAVSDFVYKRIDSQYGQ